MLKEFIDLDRKLADLDFKVFFEKSEKLIKLTKEANSLNSKLMKTLTIDGVKNINKSGHSKVFITSLFNFLKSENLARSEKIQFLNGLEILIVQLAIDNELLEEAKFFNSFLHSRDLDKHKNFIDTILATKSYGKLINLIKISDNIHFENSQIIRTLFTSGCRDVKIFKDLVFQFGYSINDIGVISESSSRGSLSHLVCASFEVQSFFKDFTDVFAHIINLETDFLLRDGNRINIIKMITLNNSISPIERVNRLNALLSLDLIPPPMLLDVINFIMERTVFIDSVNTNIFNTLFTNKVFNSNSSHKQIVIERLINLDFSPQINQFRLENLRKNDPVYVIYELLHRLSSQLIAVDNLYLLSLWLDKSLNLQFNIGFLDYLVSVLSDDELSKFKVNQSVDNVIKKALSKRGIEQKEKSIKFIVGNVINNVSNKGVIQSSVFNTTSSVNPSMFSINNELLSKISEKNIIALVSSIKDNLDSFRVIYASKTPSPEYHYFNEEVPTQINLLLDGYIKNRGFGTIAQQTAQVKKIIQDLTNIEVKTFEIIEILLIETTS